TAITLPWVAGVGIPRLVLMFILGLSLGSGLLARLPVPLYRGFENARFVLQLPRMERMWADHAHEYELPRIKAMVGSSTVDVTGAEQAIAILNGFNYKPAPIFQTYAADTPYLARLNADFYRSEHAPGFIVVSREYRLDDRLPNLDESLSRLVISERYRQVAFEKGYRLLQRRTATQEFKRQKISSEGQAGERLAVEGGDWCEIVMQENLLGRLTRLLWASPPVFVDVWSNGEQSVRYRFVPSLAKAGFVVPDGIVGMAVSKTPASLLCFQPQFNFKLYREVKDVNF
ncbi:MAG TPA: hypothetical protein VG146_18855, partial [Verrucomicrobiae bacterium]|nr:hypothetical protein [Verrucomicrobiae bacterium]